MKLTQSQQNFYPGKFRLNNNFFNPSNQSSRGQISRASMHCKTSSIRFPKKLSVPDMVTYKLIIDKQLRKSNLVKNAFEFIENMNSAQIQCILMIHIKKQKQEEEQNNKFEYHQFRFYFVVGTGGFGKVWKVQDKKTNKYYAIKQMNKAVVIQKKSVNSVLNEKNLLIKLRHPFLINIQSSFQDKNYLYLVMDYLSGGDLRYHLGQNKTFSEEQTSQVITFIQ